MNFRDLAEDRGWGRARRESLEGDTRIDVLFLVRQPFMVKTFEPIYRHLTGDAAVLPCSLEARQTETSIPVLDPDTIGDVDENIIDINPRVVVVNNYYLVHHNDWHDLYETVMMQHGYTTAPREELDPDKTRPAYEWVDHYLAPGYEWQRTIGRRVDTEIHTVGIPEADDLVAEQDHDPVDETGTPTALFSPTNTRWGKGCLETQAQNIVETWDDSDWNLLFRPHPYDVHRADHDIVNRCLRQIRDSDNIILDVDRNPHESMKSADLMISDDSGIVTEWLHTGRPLIQVTDISGNRELRRLGIHVDGTPTPQRASRLIKRGYEDEIYPISEEIGQLGIPLDGQSGRRSATVIENLY